MYGVLCVWFMEYGVCACVCVCNLWCVVCVCAMYAHICMWGCMCTYVGVYVYVGRLHVLREKRMLGMLLCHFSV